MLNFQYNKKAKYCKIELQDSIKLVILNCLHNIDSHAKSIKLSSLS